MHLWEGKSRAWYRNGVAGLQLWGPECAYGTRLPWVKGDLIIPRRIPLTWDGQFALDVGLVKWLCSGHTPDFQCSERAGMVGWNVVGVHCAPTTLCWLQQPREGHYKPAQCKAALQQLPTRARIREAQKWVKIPFAQNTPPVCPCLALGTGKEEQQC